MWTNAQLTLEIVAEDGDEVILRVETPVGPVSIMGTVSIEDCVLSLDGAHMDGPGPGELKRAGLHAIARKVLEHYNATQIYAQGGKRTTGLRKGKTPPRFCYPRK